MPAREASPKFRKGFLKTGDDLSVGAAVKVCIEKKEVDGAKRTGYRSGIPMRSGALGMRVDGGFCSSGACRKYRRGGGGGQLL